MLDANTFTHKDVIEYLNNNFTNLKVDADTKYGTQLFSDHHGKSYPLVLFLDSTQNELDRIYGFLEPELFLEKLINIKNGNNTFPALRAQFESGDQSSETISLLASKYAEQGEDSIAIILYGNILKSKNLSLSSFWKAKYFLSSQKLKENNPNALKQYIITYDESPYIKEAVNKLIRYFQETKNKEKELECWNNYIHLFTNDPWFLNQYSWRMTEINKNLDVALNQVNHALNIINKEDNGIANIIDTKAEILWKLGRTNEAIKVIEQAMLLDSKNEYYITQKNKFLDTTN